MAGRSYRVHRITERRAKFDVPEGKRKYHVSCIRPYVDLSRKVNKFAELVATMVV
jgi:hypothetical protein